MKYTDCSVTSAHASEYPWGGWRIKSVISEPSFTGSLNGRSCKLVFFISVPFSWLEMWQLHFPHSLQAPFSVWARICEIWRGEVRQELSAFPLPLFLSGSKCLEMDFSVHFTSIPSPLQEMEALIVAALPTSAGLQTLDCSHRMCLETTIQVQVLKVKGLLGAHSWNVVFTFC